MEKSEPIEIHSVSICFVCKLCRCIFHQLSHFLVHKKQEHVVDFQNIKCIVFEEGTLEQNFVDVFPEANEFSTVAVDLSNFSNNKSETIGTNLPNELKLATVGIDDSNPPTTLAPFQYSEGKEEDQHNQSYSYVAQESSVDSLSSDIINPFPSDLVLDSIEVEIASADCTDAESIDTISEPENENEDIRTEVVPNAANILNGLNVEPNVEPESKQPITNQQDPPKVIIHRTSKPLHNPYVRLSRLTNKELEAKLEANRIIINSEKKTNYVYHAKSDYDVIILDDKNDDEDDCSDVDPNWENDSDIEFIPETEKNRSKRRASNNRFTSKSSSVKNCKSVCTARPQKSDKSIQDIRESYKFPSPESDVESDVDSLTLKEWLLKQKSKIQIGFNGNPTNVILLEPDLLSRIKNTNILPSPSHPIQCKLCSTSLVEETELKIHVKNCWLYNKMRHRYCTICDKKLFRPAYLRQHFVKIHGTEKEKETFFTFSCPLCSKKFVREWSLNYHMESHKNLSEQSRPHHCDICNKSFRLRRQLTLHKFVHSEDRPFKCSHNGCSYSSKDYYNLKHHERRHLIQDANGNSNDHDADIIMINPNSDSAIMNGVEDGDEGVIREIPRPFLCNICGKGFRLKSHLRSHSIIHSETKPYKCTYQSCTFSCRDPRSLKHHRKRHYSSNSKVNERLFIFPNAQIYERDSTPLVDWLITERLIGHEDPETQNIILIEPDPTTLTEDIEPIVIGVNNPIKCLLCWEKLCSEAEVKLHCKHCFLKNKQRHRYCVPCEKNFSNSLALRNHNVRMHIPEMEQSSEKKQSSPRKEQSSAEEKQISITDRKKFKCPVCSKEYLDKSYLKFHIESHMNKEDQHRPFICEVCGLTFRRSVYLKHHLRLHTDVKLFKCTMNNCNRSFKTAKYVRLHQKLFHATETPFSCPIESCEKAFKTAYHVKIHLVSHSGVQNYACKEPGCGKKFTASGTLRTHVVLKHGDKRNLPQFPCQVCSKIFHQKSVLRSHFRLVHSEERPYKCKYEGCTADFKIPWLLLEHERGHTGEQPFVCEICGKSYARMKPFSRHKSLHKIQKNPRKK